MWIMVDLNSENCITFYRLEEHPESFESVILHNTYTNHIKNSTTSKARKKEYCT